MSASVLFAGANGSNTPSLSLMMSGRGKAGGDDVEASKSLSGSEGKPNVRNPLH